jgi:hypothetical protein
MTDRVGLGQLRGYFPQQRMSTYLLPLPDHGLLYVKNPKAACSTLLFWLDLLHTGDDTFAPHSVHKEHRLPRIRDVGRDRVAEMLGGAAYRFSFVREPRRRLESAYWDKIVAKAPRWHARVQTALGVPVDLDAEISFEEFVSAIEQQHPVQEMDPHWRPQHVNLLHPVVTYDHVGHLETFDADLARVRDEAGLPDVPVRDRNVQHQPVRASVYDGRPDLVRRVETLYALDMELYGY